MQIKEKDIAQQKSKHKERLNRRSKEKSNLMQQFLKAII